MSHPVSGNWVCKHQIGVRAARRAVILFHTCLLSLLTVGCGQGEQNSSGRETVSSNSLEANSQTQPNTSGAHDQFTLQHYQLQISPEDLARLEGDEFSNQTHPANFVADGKRFPGVKVRIRGSWSRTWPKKSLKIFFEDGNRFEGQHSLNLNSGWRDPAFVREALAYYVYNTCGVRAPIARIVRLDLNGNFGGLYVEVEQPGKEFLNRIGLPGASVYKASSRGRDADERDVGSVEAYQACYTKETKKTDGYAELQAFCHELRTATNLVQFFENRVDLPSYINYLAATVLIQHWDGFNKNHFLVCDRQGSKKWSVVPWDLDRTFGDHWNGRFDEARLPVLLGTRSLPGVTGWNRMEDRFLSDPELRARFLARLSELLNSEFTEEKLFPILDRYEAEIAALVAKDREKWPGSNPDVRAGIRQVKQFIKERRRFLLSEVTRL